VLIFVKVLWWLGSLSVVMAFVGMAPGIYQIGKAAAVAPAGARVADAKAVVATKSQPFAKEIVWGMLFAALFAAAVYLVYRLAPNNVASHVWLLLAAGVILIAAIVGTALFFAGLNARRGWAPIFSVNGLIGFLVAALWGILGYSIALTEGSPVLGGFSRALLQGTGGDLAFETGTLQVPEINYAILHMSLAVLASALIVSPFARRVSARFLCSFSLLWVLLIYAPVAHWVWSGDGWLNRGSDFATLLDGAGGSVIYLNAGLAGLACSLHFGSTTNEPVRKNGYLFLGTLMLWVGGFVLNLSMAAILGADAVLVMLTNWTASIGAALAWVFMEWVMRRRMTTSGIWLGLFTGIVAIAAGSGIVGPIQGLWIGPVAGALASLCISLWARPDGSNYCLVYVVGGLVGVLLTGLLSTVEFSRQCTGVAAVGAYGLFGSFIILNVLNWFIPSGVPVESDLPGDVAVETRALATD
jgi:ammonium transporter, Amt family